MSKPTIIGCGTGRCGTKSLSKILSTCEMTEVTHETDPKLYWENDKNYEEKLEQFKDGLDDVALYYGKYIERFLEDLDDVRVIVLMRDKDEVIESFKAVTVDRNHWNGEITEEWDRCFPDYGESDKDAAISMYYQQYYENIPLKDERVLVIPTAGLSWKKTQEAICEHCEIPVEDRNYSEDPVYNKREKHVGYRT